MKLLTSLLTIYLVFLGLAYGRWDLPTNATILPPSKTGGSGNGTAPPPSTLPPTRTPTQPPSSSSSGPPAPTVTVSHGDTVEVPVGAVVIGGVGGGFFVVTGLAGGASAPVAIAAGASAVASSASGSGDDPNDPDDPDQPTFTPTELPTETPTLPTTTASASSSGTAVPYMISPKEGADTAGFFAHLGRLIAPAVPTSIDIPDTTVEGGNLTLMWVAPLTPAQAAEVKRDAAVEGLALSNPLQDVDPVEARHGARVPPNAATGKGAAAQKLKRAFTQIDTSDYELIQLSTPEGTTEPKNTYDIDDSAGAGVSVYVVDSSFYLDHQEFEDDGSSGGREIRTIDVPDMNGDAPDRDDDTHGTCAASKAVGNSAGAAPKANLIAVDLANRRVATLIAGLALVGQDVASKGLQGKAVVSCSVTADADSITDVGIAKLQKVLDVLMNKLDVPVVLSAGNYGGDINTYPPSLAADNLPLINVGAVNEAGEIAEWSQGGELLTTAAGGVDIVCATNEGPDAYRLKQGTSFSAPLVAGMVAYWLGNPSYQEAGAFPAGKVAEAAKVSITELHWARIEGGYDVAWNGEGACDEEAQPTGDGASTSGQRRRFLRRHGSLGRRSLGSLVNACSAPKSQPSSSSSSMIPEGTPPPQATTPPPSSSSSSSFGTVPTNAPPPPTTTPVPSPVACYNFDVKCYGFCCPAEGNPCTNDIGYCSCGDGTGSTGIVPDNAVCPMPAGS